jgi:hypothetical protein
VALVVESVEEMSAAALRAAHYLARVGPDPGGWGYNRRVGVDYDSTAQALIVLRGHGIEAPGFLHQWMLEGQHPSGGYPTYPPPEAGPANGWQHPHPDTTQMVALYHVRHHHRAPGEHCLRWLDTVRVEGLVPSYWWPGHGYGLWLAGRLGPPLVPEHTANELLEMGHSLPHLAFVLSAAADVVDQTALDTGVVRLLAQQLADGSWPCAPCLRLTDKRSAVAGAAATGRLVRDPRRVFSTAHAVAALDRVRRAVAEDAGVGSWPRDTE